jgi:hypothetical protein
LNSHDHPPKKMSSQFRMLSRQETDTPTKNVGIIVSYQRNHQHNNNPKGPSPCRRVKQTNSSTFDTLLSSQGSSAHRSWRPFGRSLPGQPGKTYRSRSGHAIRPFSFPILRTTVSPSPWWPARGVLTSSLERWCEGVVSRGRRPGRLAVPSRRSLATGETLGEGPNTVKSKRRDPGHKRCFRRSGGV